MSSSATIRIRLALSLGFTALALASSMSASAQLAVPAAVARWTINYDGSDHGPASISDVGPSFVGSASLAAGTVSGAAVPSAFALGSAAAGSFVGASDASSFMNYEAGFDTIVWFVIHANSLADYNALRSKLIASRNDLPANPQGNIAGYGVHLAGAYGVYSACPTLTLAQLELGANCAGSAVAALSSTGDSTLGGSLPDDPSPFAFLSKPGLVSGVADSFSGLGGSPVPSSGTYKSFSTTGLIASLGPNTLSFAGSFTLHTVIRGNVAFGGTQSTWAFVDPVVSLEPALGLDPTHFALSLSPGAVNALGGAPLLVPEPQRLPALVVGVLFLAVLAPRATRLT